jgi:hypothetical protein
MKKIKRFLANFILELRTLIIHIAYEIDGFLARFEMNLRSRAVNSNGGTKQKRSKKNSKSYKHKRS